MMYAHALRHLNRASDLMQISKQTKGQARQANVQTKRQGFGGPKKRSMSDSDESDAEIKRSRFVTDLSQGGVVDYKKGDYYDKNLDRKLIIRSAFTTSVTKAHKPICDRLTDWCKDGTICSDQKLIPGDATDPHKKLSIFRTCIQRLRMRMQVHSEQPEVILLHLPPEQEPETFTVPHKHDSSKKDNHVELRYDQLPQWLIEADFSDMVQLFYNFTTTSQTVIDTHEIKDQPYQSTLEALQGMKKHIENILSQTEPEWMKELERAGIIWKPEWGDEADAEQWLEGRRHRGFEIKSPTALEIAEELKHAQKNTENILSAIQGNQDMTNKILGCIELLTVRDHSPDWIKLAQTLVEPSTVTPTDQGVMFHLQDLQSMALKYIKVPKSRRHFEVQHGPGGPNVNDFFYREIIVVARKFHKKLKDVLKERHIPFKTIAELLKKTGDQSIYLLYDKQTQLHVWKHNPPAPRDPDPQEKPDRIDWVREAFDVSGVAYKTIELKCSQEDEARAERWMLEFMNFHKSSDAALTKLPQWAEIQDDIDQDGKERFRGESVIETLPVQLENTKKASYASANVVWGVLQKLLANVLKGVFDFYFLAIRPPSHHGHSTRQTHGLNRYTHGFCVVNNTAMLIYYLAKKGQNVLLIDIDYHRGDGNQQNLENMRRPYRERRIELIDVYQLQDFPNPKGLSADESCLCIKKAECNSKRHYHGITRKDFGRKRRESLDELAKKILPKFIHDKNQKAEHFTVVLSFGTDAHAMDASSDAQGRNPKLKNPKLGPFVPSYQLKNKYTPAITEDYYQFGRLLAKYRKECDFSVVAVLEGGYHQMSLQCSIAGFLQGWTGVPMSDELEEPSCGPLSHDDFKRWDNAR